MNCEGSGDDCFDPEKNPVLRREIKAARKNHVPDNYIRRVIQFAKQGYNDIDFPIYDTDWDSDAYLTVSGQNSNNTVRVTDEFLKAVEADGDWDLFWRTKPGKIAKTVKARDLWEKIGHAAWACADPGLQFHTTINDWHTCPASGPIIASNPCSEYMFLDDTACNLASLNLLAFRTRRRTRFDVEGYEHAVRLWTIVLEISVLMAQFPSREIAQRSYEFRTLGPRLRQYRRAPDVVRHPLRFRGRPRHLRCADRDHDRRLLRHLRRDGGGARAVPRLSRRTATHMLRVMRNHRRAAHGERTGYENIATPPVPLDHSHRRCRDIEGDCRRLSRTPSAWDRALDARRSSTAIAMRRRRSSRRPARSAW